MAVTNFIPEIWSARLLRNLRRSTVFTQLLNHGWQSELSSSGDTAHIFALDDVTISDYSRTSDLPAVEVLNTTQQTIVLDQEKTFNFGIEDLDKAQIAGSLIDAATRKAGQKLGEVVDSYMHGLFKAGAQAAGNTLAWKDSTKQNRTDLDYLARMKKLALQNNIPQNELWLVVGPETLENMLNSLKASFGSSVSAATLRSDPADLMGGYVDNIMGVDIWASTEIDTTGSGATQREACIGGTRYSMAFIDQVRKIEPYRPERRMMDAVKGLYNYGAKQVEETLFDIRILTAK